MDRKHPVGMTGCFLSRKWGDTGPGAEFGGGGMNVTERSFLWG